MTQAYSDPSRADDPHALPDLEIFELTATELAEYEEELIWEYLKRPEFRLATMNSRDRERMLDTIVEEEGLQGGWFYWYCLPGCMPDSTPYGPFETAKQALADAREQAGCAA